MSSGDDFPCCAPRAPADLEAAEAEAEFYAAVLCLVLGLVLADVLAHPEAAARLAADYDAARTRGSGRHGG